MQLIHAFPLTETRTAPGIRVLLLSGEGENGPIARRLAGLGARVETRDELYTALSEILDDPHGARLFVVDCDTTNAQGLAGARRALQILTETRRHIPAILISREVSLQHFPEDRLQPVELRAPLSAVSLKVGYEHAMRPQIELGWGPGAGWAAE